MKNRVRQIRKKKELSAEALADMLGCTRDTIYNLEKEARGLTHDWMRRLAAALECAPSDFLPDEEFDPRLNEQQRQLLYVFDHISEENQTRLSMIITATAGALDDAENGRHGSLDRPLSLVKT